MSMNLESEGIGFNSWLLVDLGQYTGKAPQEDHEENVLINKADLLKLLTANKNTTQIV